MKYENINLNNIKKTTSHKYFKKLLGLSFTFETIRPAINTVEVGFRRIQFTWNGRASDSMRTVGIISADRLL